MPDIYQVWGNGGKGWTVFYRLEDQRPRYLDIIAPNRDAAVANASLQLRERYYGYPKKVVF